jgi:hypothetical protein
MRCCALVQFTSKKNGSKLLSRPIMLSIDGSNVNNVTLLLRMRHYFQYKSQVVTFVSCIHCC